VTGYKLEGRGSIPGSSEIFSSAQRADRLWGPPSLKFNGYRGSFPGGKAAGMWSSPHLHLLQKSRYLHCPVRLHSVVLNLLRTRTTLSLTLPYIYMSYYVNKVAEWSQDSSIGIVTDYKLDGRGSIPGRSKIFLFCMASRLALGLTQPHIQWVPGTPSTR
jgi:hypothetical protein